jgi:diguanylate cyclase (GGDEF)-like protein
MFSIDIRTVIFFMVLIDAISLIIMIVLWVQNRNHFTGLSLWVVDYVFQMLAAALILSRGLIPDFMSMVLSNAMVVGGTLILYIGLQRFIGKKSSQIHNYFLLAVFIFIHTYYTLIQPSLNARTVNLNAGLLIVCVQSMWLMLVTVDSQMRSLTRGVGLVFGGLSVISLVQIVGITIIPAQSNDFFTSGVFEASMVILQQLFFLLLTFSLILMVNRRLFREVEELSNTDSLTGFLNRRSFETQAEREMLLAARHAQPLSFLFLDIDHFKKVNDSYGHEVGDSVLGEVADSCSKCLRTTDIKVRLGGEEFAFLCPNTSSQGALVLAERVQKAIAEHNFNPAGPPLKITASIGISEVDYNNDTLDRLIKRADEALYQAKDRGRNQVVLWKPISN